METIKHNETNKDMKGFLRISKPTKSTYTHLSLAEKVELLEQQLKQALERIEKLEGGNENV